MDVYSDISAMPKDAPSAATIGSFDGAHLGHRRIIRRLTAIARERSLKSVLITFDPHPRVVTSRDGSEIRLLTTTEEKIALVERLGVDRLLALRFTERLATTPPEEFVKRYFVEGLRVEAAVVGYDHRFGKRREGDAETLRALGERNGFSVETIPPVLLDGVEIGSTAIRRALLDGDLDTANRMLGRPYAISGVVVKDRGEGGRIGFPTANIATRNPWKLLPADGVYAVRVNRNGERLEGVMNVGERPTFETDEAKTVEAHLFDFEGNLYGERLEAELIARLRDERKFASVGALVAQIREDAARAKVILRERV